MLALLWREKGWEVVEEVETRVASAVNVAEVASVLAKVGHSIAEVHASIAQLDVEVVVFDEPQAFEVGRLRPVTERFGLSLGDRACIALASARGAPVLTSDRKWAQAGLDVEVVAFR
jgi:PIN domain nuclease of toxin-antitoxin system